MRYLFLIILTGSLSWPLAASEREQLFQSEASRNAQLVELFTSQGCSSCPPAERWLNKFNQDPLLWQRYFPLAWHVDYWDHLGWKDKFSTVDHTRRQYLYYHQGRSEAVYTPQTMVNGKEWRGLLASPRHPLPDPGPTQGKAFSARLKGNSVEAVGEGLLNIALVRTQFSQRIYRGENAGRRLDQAFVVLGYSQWASENARWRAELPPTTDNLDADAIVLWVTQPGDSTPLAIAGGYLAD